MSSRGSTTQAFVWGQVLMAVPLGIALGLQGAMLTELDVTSASRRVEPLHQAASAIVVLRQEGLRRAGIICLVLGGYDMVDAMRARLGVRMPRVIVALSAFAGQRDIDESLPAAFRRISPNRSTA